MDGWNGERQIGVTLAEIEPKHVERYTFAASYVKGHQEVLDAACGVGYGAFILSKKVNHLVAVDNSPETIEYAMENWPGENIKYILFDLNKENYTSLGLFSAIVSFETIEHLEPEIADTLNKFDDILLPNGILIISHPENQGPGAKFHNHHNIRGDAVMTYLKEELQYIIIHSWMQPGRFEYPYHVIVAKKWQK